MSDGAPSSRGSPHVYSAIEQDEESGFSQFLNYRPKNTNWNHLGVIMIVLVSLMIILTVIVLSVVLTVGTDDDSSKDHKNGKEPFVFDNIFNISASGIGVRWLKWSDASRKLDTSKASQPSFLYQNKSDSTITQQMILPDAKTFPDLRANRVIFNFTEWQDRSPQLMQGIQRSVYLESNTAITDNIVGLVPQYLLLAKNYTKIWRHSYNAKLLVYDLSSNTLTELDQSNTQPNEMNPVWSPTAPLVAYVRENDIYMVNMTAGTAPIRVTSTGTPSRQADGQLFINGLQTWVYEEEIFSDNNALWWSPDGSKLAFMSSNATEVPNFMMKMYNNKAYPDIVNIDYPKPGFPNPVVAINVYDLATRTIAPVAIPESPDSYINNVKWADDNTLAVSWLNRAQNKQKLYVANMNTFPDISTRVLMEQNSKAWIESTFNLMFLKTSTNSINYFVDTTFNAVGYKQLALYDYNNGEFIKFVTDPSNNARWTVTNVLEWDPDTQSIYYLSTEMDVKERHVYKVSLTDQKRTKITEGPGMWQVSFGPIAPGVMPCSVHFFSGNGNFDQVPTTNLTCPGINIMLENNAQLKSILDKKAMPTLKYISVPSGPNQLEAFLLLPPDFNNNVRYPLLINVYGGPGSQAVTRGFFLGYDVYLASQGYIVAKIDGRGTSTKDADFMFSVYLNLGHYETEDQINAAKYFQTLNFVDRNRIGIWGWSYGGYMAGMVASDLRSRGVIKSSMSVAPVTDWRFYDSVYTERYMSIPSTNPSGYHNSSVLYRAQNIANVNYFLAHGTADDNVHIENAYELSRRLVSSGVIYDEMMYTNSDHSIVNDKSRPHLYHKLTDFLDRKLKN